MIKYEFLQRGLNLALSIIMLIYIMKFKPFKEKGILVSNMIAEAFNCLLFLVIFLRSFVELFKVDAYFDYFFIGIITGQIFVQYVFTFILLIIEIKKIFSASLKKNTSILKSSNQEIASRID